MEILDAIIIGIGCLSVLLFIVFLTYAIKFRGSKIRSVFITGVIETIVCLAAIVFVVLSNMNVKFITDLNLTIFNKQIIYTIIVFLLGYSLLMATIGLFYMGTGNRSHNSNLALIAGVLLISSIGAPIGIILMVAHVFTTRPEAAALKRRTTGEATTQVAHSEAQDDPRPEGGRRHPSKSDFAKMGMPVHLVPIGAKQLKTLKKQVGGDGIHLLSEATRPFAIKALIKIGILLVLFIAIALILFFSGEKDAIVYILIAYIVFSFLFCRQSQIISCYAELNGGGLFTLLSLVCLLMSLPFKFIFFCLSIAFGGSGGKAKSLSDPRIGIPKNIGLDGLIAEGEAYDEYYRMMNTFDRMNEGAEKAYYERQYKSASEHISGLESEAPYMSAAKQRQAETLKGEYERNLDEAKRHLNK